MLSDNQKYESTREENSVDKLEMLSKMEEDYVKLKYNVHPHERK